MKYEHIRFGGIIMQMENKLLRTFESSVIGPGFVPWSRTAAKYSET